MKEVYEAIYTALINDDELVERVSLENIRRGLQEPSDFPTVRFYSTECRAMGDDLGSSEMIEEHFSISILMDNDLMIERIADAVINALKVENLQDTDVMFHSIRYSGDIRGTWFDPLRKKHRKDMSFKLVYSPAL